MGRSGGADPIPPFCGEAEDELLFVSLEIEVGPIGLDWAWEGFRIVIAVTLSFGVVLGGRRAEVVPLVTGWRRGLQEVRSVVGFFIF